MSIYQQKSCEKDMISADKFMLFINAVYDVVIGEVWNSYLKSWLYFHSAFDGEHSRFVSCPASTSDTVVDIPV